MVPTRVKFDSRFNCVEKLNITNWQIIGNNVKKLSEKRILQVQQNFIQTSHTNLDLFQFK